MNQDEFNSVPTETENKKTKKKKATFGELLRDLFKDKRPWYKRLITAVLAAFAFSYTLYIFGIYEIYITNASFYTFSFDDLKIPALLLGLSVTLILTGVLMLLRGKIFNYFTTVIFSITVCSYIQCNFLNHSLGALDGTAIAWETMSGSMFLNLFIWALIFLVPFIVLYFNKKFWRRMVCFVSALLILMQTAGFVKLYVEGDFFDVSSNGYLSNSTIYEVSPKNNVVVFLIDRCGFNTMEKVFKKYPDIPRGLDGFTDYDNVLGSYSRTFPSVCYFLTGVKCDYDIPIGEYFKKAWDEGTLLPDIKNAGFDTKVYTEVNYVIKNTDNVVGKIDNVGQKIKKADVRSMLDSMVDLSLYRYMPTALKPFFWCYTGDLERISTTGDGTFTSDIYATNDPNFCQNLREDGVTQKLEGEGSFIFYHMRGAHEPYQMDADGNKSQTSDEFQQTAGDMRAILFYIEELKRLGIYDDTTIIITADHGVTGTVEKLGDMRSITLLVKPKGADTTKHLKYNSAPLTHDNIRAYIAKSFGIDYSAYGPAIDDVEEDADVTRHFYMSGCDKLHLHRDTNLITYEIKGDVKDFDNWTIIDEKEIEYPFYDAGNKR